ncbi:DUF3306 domain-containing protein [Acidovorax sp. 16-64-162]|uniref:DUF3306 domain-containing protein n=1 Tax=Acidovorax sp. 16-64-162 TaxID=1970307 RepID=UPI0034599CFA
MADGFLGRWSQRKRDVREGKPLQEPAPAPVPLEPAAAPGSRPQAVNAQAAPVPATSAAAAAEPPPPTLADAQALTSDSDFKPFVARGVAPEVRNAAMKKLFADPHYNVMDGLDIYIGDYSIPDPSPRPWPRCRQWPLETVRLGMMLTPASAKAWHSRGTALNYPARR